MIVLSFASLFVVYLWRYSGFVNAVRAYHVRSEHCMGVPRHRVVKISVQVVSFSNFLLNLYPL